MPAKRSDTRAGCRQKAASFAADGLHEPQQQARQRHDYIIFYAGRPKRYASPTAYGAKSAGKRGVHARASVSLILGLLRLVFSLRAYSQYEPITAREISAMPSDI